MLIYTHVQFADATINEGPGTVDDYVADFFSHGETQNVRESYMATQMHKHRGSRLYRQYMHRVWHKKLVMKLWRHTLKMCLALPKTQM